MIGPSAPNGPPEPIDMADESGFRIATFGSTRLPLIRARQENIERLIAYTLPETTAMLALIRRFQFLIAENEDPRSITAVLDLRQTPAVQ